MNRADLARVGSADLMNTLTGDDWSKELLCFNMGLSENRVYSQL
jgi:hypothetical protein